MIHGVGSDTQFVSDSFLVHCNILALTNKPFIHPTMSFRTLAARILYLKIKDIVKYVYVRSEHYTT